MKTSNKILLTTFISVLLILTLIHVALNQRYKNGQFTVRDLGPNVETIALKPVKFVKLHSLGHVMISPSDSFKLELSKNMPSGFQHYVSGDTLVISGSSKEQPYSEFETVDMDHPQVKIYLPQVELISASDATLMIGGATDSLKAGIFKIELFQSKVLFGSRGRDDESFMYYGDVSVYAKERSQVELSSRNISFNSLAAKLERSIFSEHVAGKIKTFSITADDSSTIQVAGSNLKKLVATTTE